MKLSRYFILLYPIKCLTFVQRDIIIKLDKRKEDCYLMSKKMGRPTENPRAYRIGIRLDEKHKKILDEYIKKNNSTITNAVSRAIELLEAEIEK